MQCDGEKIETTLAQRKTKKLGSICFGLDIVWLITIIASNFKFFFDNRNLNSFLIHTIIVQKLKMWMRETKLLHVVGTSA